MITNQQIEAAFQWGRPEEKATSRGDRIMRKAPISPEADAFYHANRSELAAAGVSRSEWPKFSGKFGFTWWQEIPREVQQQRETDKVASRATDADIEILRPPGLEYMPFQKAGVAYMRGKPGVLLADEMGLGKTIQIIGHINDNPAIQKVLIVCPAFLTLNWMRELRKWLVRPLHIGLVDGKVFPTTDIVIIGYSMLAKWVTRLETVHWDLIAADECHYVKNPNAQRSKVLLGYKPRRDEPAELAKAPLMSRMRIAASGTPICNNPPELWPIIKWVRPDVWNSWWQFTTRYCGMVRGDFGMTRGTGDNLAELQEKLRATTMIRRLKADVLKELPDKVRSVVVLECPSAVRRAEAAARQQFQSVTDEEIDEAQVAVELAKCGDDPEAYAAAVGKLGKSVKVKFEECSKVRHETALAKVPHTVEFIKGELEGGVEKLLLFAHHLDVIDQLAEGLKEFGVLTMTGSDDVRVRQANVDRFQNSSDVRVFILGLIPGGVGWTLTAAKHVYFHELDWVPGNVAQCEDRAHRIGQKDTVFVKHIVFDGTIDCNIASTLVSKAAVILRALDKRPDPSQIKQVDPVTKAFEVIAEREPLAMTPPKHVSPRRSELDALASKMTPAAVESIHAALQVLAEMCDGASKIDGAGFNKMDTRIGKELAYAGSLTNRQAALGFMIARKYKKQIGDLRGAVESQLA